MCITMYFSQIQYLFWLKLVILWSNIITRRIALNYIKMKQIKFEKNVPSYL